MDYSEGIQHILNLSTKTGSFSPYEGIKINYPGRKNTGDYCLTVKGGQTPTHESICKHLYYLIKNGNYNFNALNSFLSDFYSNGTNTNYTDKTLKYLQYLIYWVTLQEEINYPRNKGFAGINIAFCRFFEAIYCTQPLSNFNIKTIQMRCNNHGYNKPNLYNITNAPNFYHC
ncbi:hypothetical protein DZC34_19455 [Clostridium botulinum]|nr:hypothetical protein DZC34_19455 [Clostridium botulinum]